MLRHITRTCGLALALGVLALVPLTAGADHFPPPADEYPSHFASTVVTPNKDRSGNHRSYRDEPWLGGADRPAEYAGEAQPAIEQIADSGHLTMDVIRFLEANIWEFDYAEPAIAEPGPWYPSPDAAGRLFPDRVPY